MLENAVTNSFNLSGLNICVYMHIYLFLIFESEYFVKGTFPKLCIK